MKPNILFIFSDQHRAHALSCYGDPNIDTPHIDRLAAEGVRFTNAYSTSPICSPFRASLYTGQYITTHGVTSLFKPLLPNQPVLPEVLRNAGYHTSHMGKWHLTGGDCPSHFVSPYFRPGWDEWLGWDNSNRQWDTEYGAGDMPTPILKFKKYQTDALTDLTVEWLKKYDREKPWFHVMSAEPPHNGTAADGRPVYDAPEEHMAQFADKKLEYHPNYQKLLNDLDDSEKNLRGYYAQIKNLDDNIGRILGTLEETGQLDNTIILYFSDHGDMMGSHGGRQKSRPEEESTRIPFIVRWPERVKQGLVADALISGVDIMPTVLTLAGVDIPDSVEGVDVSPVLRGETDTVQDDILLQYERSFFSYENADRETWRTIRQGDWKYTVRLTGGPHQLFNITEDRYEMNNLIASDAHRDIRDKLDARLRERCNAVGDDFFEKRKQYI